MSKPLPIRPLRGEASTSQNLKQFDASNEEQDLFIYLARLAFDYEESAD